MKYQDGVEWEIVLVFEQDRNGFFYMLQNLMDKPNKPHPKATIIEKLPLKSKLSVKSALTENAEMMVGRFSFEDSLVANGYSDGFVRIYNINTEKKICQLNTNISPHDHKPVNCLRWRPANEDLGSISSVILSANTEGRIIQHIAKTGKKLYEGVEEGNFILGLDYAIDGKRFCTGGKDNILRIYDEETKEVSQRMEGIKWHTHGHNNRIFSVKFSPDHPNILASGGWDQNINLWDLRQGNCVATIYGPKISGDAIDLRGQQVLTGANRGKDQLELWDWRNNKVIMQFQWDEEKQITNAFLYCCQFCHNSKDTVIAAGGQQMKMFSLNDGSEMIEVKVEEGSTLYTADSSYSTNKYLTGGSSGTMFYMVGVKSYQ